MPPSDLPQFDPEVKRQMDRDLGHAPMSGGSDNEGFLDFMIGGVLGLVLYPIFSLFGLIDD